jgi:hypothetical protein
MPLRRNLSHREYVLIARAMAAIADVAGVQFEERPRVTLVIRCGGTGRASDDLICTDVSLPEVVAALLQTLERAEWGGLDS